MPFWPFQRKRPQPFSPAELRNQLIEAAASGSHKRLHTFCMQNKAVIAAHIDFLCSASPEMRADAAAMENYIQCLGATAECLAKECGAPELWNKLCGTPDSNPLVRWETWFQESAQRLERLEHAEMIVELRRFIEEAKRLEGKTARLNEALFYGRLGECLFHSGKVSESIDAWRSARELCRTIGDVEGQRAYLGNLLEAHRYLGNTAEAIRIGTEAAAFAESHGLNVEALRKRVGRMRRGEPLCRVVLTRDGLEFELGEFSPAADGHYNFEFRRNRLSLQMSTALTRQGNELASSGQLADALEKYREATTVDPYDPDPLFQSGVCLLELGAYAQARESFEEVERLAPGWFRCRFDCWLAKALEDGEVTENEFRILRALDDGGLPPKEAKEMALQAVAAYPQFAAFHLFLGDLYRNEGDNAKAVACYRQGLTLVVEPDLESRLLCALAGLLPADSLERRELIQRALSLKGSLVAQAIAVFIPVE